MVVEIWSDIMCPFCYMGKRHFEAARDQFGKPVEVVWRSFQLDPSIPEQPGQDIHDYLAQRKGQSRDWSVQIHRQMTERAAAVGLHYDFDRLVVTNSFRAHRLIQLAKTKDLGDAAEEALFKAYFSEGRNMNDPEVLAAIGESIGLKGDEVATMLAGEAFADAVRQDTNEARQIGVPGVPFFLIDRKLAVTGAQPPEVLLGALRQAEAQ